MVIKEPSQTQDIVAIALHGQTYHPQHQPQPAEQSAG